MTADPTTRSESMTRQRCGDFGGRRRDGEFCGGLVIAGTRRCKQHSGKPKARAKAEGAVIVELHRWGLDGHTTLRDAGEVMLRLVTQSAARVELYSRLLAEAFAAAERLQEAHEHDGLDLTTPEAGPAAGDEMAAGPDAVLSDPPAVQAARADLRRIFSTGGVGALIGVKRDADRFGRIYETEEGIRGLARLEAEERDRCANFAAKAIAAGLAERQVRLAEAQGAAMYAVFARVLAGLGLSDQQALLVPVLLEREIGALTANYKHPVGGAT